MIIAPLKQFLIDIKLNNPSDTATHYVRAVIKNSVTGVVLDTIDLTDNGSNYFSKLWMTPADPTGTGTQITIIKTVYDDPDYTTESPIYGTTVENYIVRDLASTRPFLGGVGSVSAEKIDYQEIEKIVRKVVAEIKFPEIPEPKEVDLQEIKDFIAENDKTYYIIDRIKEITDEILLKLAKKEPNKQDEIIKLIKELPSQIEIKENKLDLSEVINTLKLLEAKISKEEKKETEEEKKPEIREEVKRLFNMFDIPAARKEIINKLLS